MFEKKKVILHAELAPVELQLRRIADVLEAMAQAAYDIDMHASTADMSAEDLERSDDLPAVAQEWLATIEELIEQGVPPSMLAGAYKRIGLDPPVKEDDPKPREMQRAQPGTREYAEDEADAAADEPVTARRDDDIEG